MNLKKKKLKIVGGKNMDKEIKRYEKYDACRGEVTGCCQKGAFYNPKGCN